MAVDKVTTDDVVNFVTDRFTASEQSYQGLYKKFGEWYWRYRGWMKGNVETFRNQLQIPVALSLILADVSRKTALTCGGFPVVQFMGFNPDDPQPARNAEILTSAQMDDMGILEKLYDYYLTADLMGTAVLRTGWRVDKRAMKYRWINPITNAEEIEDGEHVLFDGPDIDIVDPRDFFPPPECKKWRDAKYCIHRYRISNEDVQGGEKSGVYTKGSAKLLEGGKAAQPIDDTFMWRPWNEFSKVADKYDKEVEVLEYNGLVPDKFAKDGYSLRTIIVGNRSVLLSNEAFEFWHGSIQKKFILFSPIPDPFQLHGTGKMEILDKPQAAINKLGSLKLDILEMFASPMFFYNRSAGLDLQNLKVKPGRWFGVEGPVDDSQVRPIIPNLGGLQAIFAEMGQLSQYMQQGSGIADDVVGGIGGSDRQTAREVVIRHEEVMKRLGLEAKLAEKCVMEPLGNVMMDLNRQYLTLPKKINILGAKAEINPITGLPMPQEQTQVELSDLHMDYKARAVGASLFINRTARKQDGLMLMQTLGANPVTQQILNWPAVVAQMIELTDFGNPNELIVKAVPATNQLANAQGGAVPQGQPGEQPMQPLGMQQPQEQTPEMMGGQ